MISYLRKLLRARRFGKMREQARQDQNYEFFRQLANSSRAKRISSYTIEPLLTNQPKQEDIL